MSILKLFTAIVFSLSVMLSGVYSAPLKVETEVETYAAGENVQKTEAPELPFPLAPGDVFPKEVSFRRGKITAELGEKVDIMPNITLFPQTASIRGLIFKSNMPSVATVDAQGVITTRGKGICEITVCTENGREDTLLLTVFAIDVGNISITRPEESPYAFESIKLDATIFPSNASVSRITWSSSQEGVATVDAEGNVSCKMPGLTTITATGYGGASSSIRLVVRERMAEDVVISPDAHEGRKGESFSLNAEVFPENTTFKTLTYESSSPNIAEVDEQGNVLLKGKGSSMITVTASNGVSEEYKVFCSKTFDSTHFAQGDSRWRFSRTVAKKACLITAFAILLDNIGIEATPRSAYNAGGTGMNLNRLAEKFPFVSECAVDREKEYFSSYLDGKTYIKKPGKNAVTAIKDALDRNPEGVIVYFSQGSESHAVVAIGYVGDTIYYSDPGRVKSKGFDVTLRDTWVYVGHRMGYSNLNYLVAIDPVA